MGSHAMVVRMMMDVDCQIHAYHTTIDGCAVECPVVCGKDEMICDMGVDENGCPSKGSCMHYDATAICKDACPVQCGNDDMVCPGGTDSLGCKMPDICVPSKVPATECVDTALEKKCEEIKGKGKCHKKWPQKNCQLTCGVCTSSATDSVAGAPDTCPEV